MHFPPALSANVLPSSPSSWSWSWKHTHHPLSLNNLFYLSFRNEHHKCRCCFCAVVPFTCWLHRRPHVMFVIIRRDMWHRRCWQKWRWWWWQEQNRNPLLHPIGTPTQPQVLSAKEWLLFKLMKVSSSHHRHCHHHRRRRAWMSDWMTDPVLLLQRGGGSSRGAHLNGISCHLIFPHTDSLTHWVCPPIIVELWWLLHHRLLYSL